MTKIEEELKKAIQDAAATAPSLLKKSQMGFDFDAPATQPHHVAYLRTNARGTTSQIRAKGAPTEKEYAPGTILKFHTPENESEGKLRHKVLEDRGDRVLIEDASPHLQQHFTLKPTKVLRKKDLVEANDHDGQPAKPDHRQMVQELHDAYERHDSRGRGGTGISPDHPDYSTPEKYLGTAKKILQYKSYERLKPAAQEEIKGMLNRHISELEAAKDAPVVVEHAQPHTGHRIPSRDEAIAQRGDAAAEYAQQLDREGRTAQPDITTMKPWEVPGSKYHTAKVAADSASTDAKAASDADLHSKAASAHFDASRAASERGWRDIAVAHVDIANKHQRAYLRIAEAPVKAARAAAKELKGILESPDFGMTEAGGNGRVKVNQNGTLTVFDSYAIGGDRALESIIKKWSPGEFYNNHFKAQGYDIKVVGHDKQMRSAMFGGSGAVSVTLQVTKTAGQPEAAAPAANPYQGDPKKLIDDITRPMNITYGTGPHKKPLQLKVRHDENMVTVTYKDDAPSGRGVMYTGITRQITEEQAAAFAAAAPRIMAEVAKRIKVEDSSIELSTTPGAHRNSIFFVSDDMIPKK